MFAFSVKKGMLVLETFNLTHKLNQVQSDVDPYKSSTI